MKPRAWKASLEFQLDDYRSFRLQTAARWSGPKARVSKCSRFAKFFLDREAGEIKVRATPKEIYVSVKAEDTISEISSNSRYICIIGNREDEIYRLQKEASSKIDVSTREKQCRKSTFYDNKSV